jgi:tetratricopeptide (TPR) repeat protein
LSKILGNLAQVYVHQDRLADAETISRRALKIDEKVLPAYHPDIANDLSNLAAICSYENNYKEAASLYERAFDITEERFGKNSQQTVTVLKNMADMYDRSGDALKAKKIRKHLQGIGNSG